MINTLGDKETRTNYRQALITYLEAHEEELSEDSRRRLHENPLRVLDSKDRKDQPIVADAPSILDYLSDYAKDYFEGVTKTLEYLNISYEIDHRMVRGLDYYNHTIFEIMSDAPGMGAQTTICGGGRYDGLVEELGGPETPGIGFAMGIERILLTLEQEDVMIPSAASLDAYVVGLGEETNMESLKVVQAIRGFGFSADRDFMEGAKLVLTLGEDELAKGVINVKDSATREEKAFPLADLYEDFAAIYDEMTMPKLD